MKRIRKSFLTLAATAGLLLGASNAVTPAMATSVQFNFTGAVIQRDIELNATLPGAGTVKGTFTFDNSTGDVSAFSVDHFDLTIPTPTLVYNTSSNGTGAVTITDNGGGGILDRWLLESPATGATIPQGSTNWDPYTFDLKLEGLNNATPPPTLLTSSAMQNPPSLSSVDLTATRWRVVFTDGTNFRVTLGPLLSLTAVPLPPAVILFGAGVVALIGLGARNWQPKGSSVA